jgi:Sigma-70, region 4.
MWLSTKEAAEQLGVSVRTVQRRINSGSLEAREVPGQGGNGTIFEVYINEPGKSGKKNKEISEKNNDSSATLTTHATVQRHFSDTVVEGISKNNNELEKNTTTFQRHFNDISDRSTTFQRHCR